MLSSGMSFPAAGHNPLPPTRTSLPRLLSSLLLSFDTTFPARQLGLTFRATRKTHIVEPIQSRLDV